MIRRGEHLLITTPSDESKWGGTSHYYVLKDFDKPEILKRYRLWCRLSGEKPQANGLTNWMVEQEYIQRFERSTRKWDMRDVWRN